MAPPEERTPMVQYNIGCNYYDIYVLKVFQIENFREIENNEYFLNQSLP